jgi:membrane protein DedA with SNARE-associated domain
VVQMPYKKFLLYNFLGATVWSFVMVTLSFFAGQLVTLEQIIAWIGQFALVAVLLVVLWIVVPLLWEARKAKLERPQ